MVSEQRCHYIGKILAPQRVFLWQQVYLSSASNNNAAKTIITKLCQNSTEVDTGSIFCVSLAITIYLVYIFWNKY